MNFQSLVDFSAIYPVILGFVSALVAQVVSNFIRAWLEVRSERRKLTNSLHSEFNGELMSGIRNQANEIIAKNITVGIDTILKDARASGADEVIPLTTLMRFYQRLSALRQDGALRNRLLSRWFGETFVWWYRVYMDQGFKEWDTAHRELQDLYSWFERDSRRRFAYWRWRSATEVSRKAIEWDRWCRVADADRRDILKAMDSKQTKNSTSGANL